MTPFSFGDFKMPDVLRRLEAWEKIGENTWQGLTFLIQYDQEQMVSTPLDVIPFAFTAGDGIHFGFLTDFDYSKDLTETPIVCVTPMGESMRLVAANLNEFLQLVYAIGDAEILSYHIESSEKLARRIEALEVWPLREKCREVLKNEFSIEPLKDPFAHLESIRKKRSSQITIETSDEVGIVFTKPFSQVEPFDYWQNRSAYDVKHYLNDVDLAGRLRFYRDAATHYALTRGGDVAIGAVIMRSLAKDGLYRESAMLGKAFL